MTKRTIPFIMFVLMEITLISLGVWQLQRKAWKEAVLANIERATSMPAVSVKRLSDLDGLSEFRRVTLTCANRDQASGVSQSGFNAQSQPATRVFIICPLSSGETVSIQGDWIPDDDLITVSYPIARIEGRLRQWHISTWAERLAGVTNISPGLFKIAVDRRYYVTKVDALPPPPPNNHFAYAMQWFIFAGVLGVIFTIWMRQQRLAPAAPGA
jgi:surfeit locus 1 family protein